MNFGVDVAATFSADGADTFAVDAAFEVADGETLVVLGPSGSGKTLLLETIAGFHDHDGSVTLDGQRIDDVAPEKRHIGFVFQDYALFPHKTVTENVAFGQRYQLSRTPWSSRLLQLVLGPAEGDDFENRGAVLRDNLSKLRAGFAERGSHLRRVLRGTESDDESRLDALRYALVGKPRLVGPNPRDLLAELGVGHLADRYPPTLSGGEQQRVALARALAVRPSVLLLDEPLSSLDVPTRQSLRDDLQDLLAEKTAVHVTHNRTTARALADRIVVMNDGQIVQTGTPEEIFDQPASPLVARFTGSNVLPLDAVPAFRDRLLESTGDASHLAIRPESIQLLNGNGADPDSTARVERVTREDATSRVVLSLVTGDGDETVTLDAYSTDPPSVGETVGLRVPDGAATVC